MIPRPAKLRLSVRRVARLRFSVRHREQNALFRHVAAPGRCGATPRQAAGHYGEWLNWANALEQPPASLRGGLREGPQISVRSLTSRKSAFCNRGVTKKRTLRHPPRGAITWGAPFREERRHPPEAHSAPVDFSNAQSRSSQLTLPLGPERSCPTRSPSSGSVRRTASGVGRTARRL